VCSFVITWRNIYQRTEERSGCELNNQSRHSFLNCWNINGFLDAKHGLFSTSENLMCRVKSCEISTAIQFAPYFFLHYKSLKQLILFWCMCLQNASCSELHVLSGCICFIHNTGMRTVGVGSRFKGMKCQTHSNMSLKMTEVYCHELQFWVWGAQGMVATMCRNITEVGL